MERASVQGLLDARCTELVHEAIGLLNDTALRWLGRRYRRWAAKFAGPMRTTRSGSSRLQRS